MAISEDDVTSGIKRRGFGSLPPERRREIAGEAGKRAWKLGRAHVLTTEELQRGGSVGGKRSKRPPQSYRQHVPEGEQLV
jgi:uncharacterized protein